MADESVKVGRSDKPIIIRLDTYHIKIDDFVVHATYDQERRIREMSKEELERFKRVMGGE